MRVILAGTRTFGLAALERIAKEHQIDGVICPPDDPIRAWAERTATFWHPGTSDVAWPLHEWVGELGADLIVGAHSHAFLGRKTRAATQLGAIGYHPSLLPRHRGRDAVKWTIKMRDPIAGGSVYWFDSGVDTGPIAAQSWCHVDPAWDASDLWREKLFPTGIELLASVLGDLDQGILVAERQDERVATWEPSWERPPLHRPELLELGGPSGFEVRGRVER